MSGTQTDQPSGVMGKIFSELKDLKDRGMKDEMMEDDISPFAYLDKSQVLQGCKSFNDANFVRMHPKRCCQQLTRLLWFLIQGDTFTGPDAEDVFFGVTKLFQSTDGNLRRLVYLFLRSVADSTESSSLIIVTQSLVKDMFNDQPLYKGNALRVLASIVDASMLGQLERYFKQMIVDRDDYVSSTALTSSLSLVNRCPGSADVIGRWVGEVQTVLTSRSDMVQFHALALLRTIKKHDKLAVSKIVTQLMRGGMRSPLGLCLLIRYSNSLMASDPALQTQQALGDFLDACMRHKSDMVVFEAARAAVALPSTAGRDLAPAITMLHMFLASPKPALRYAAVRTLHKLASRDASALAKCAEDLEALIGDPNRGIAALAITTLLKIGTETGVDRLLKQIGSFVAEGSGGDELKVTVIQAIHELALRMPSKHRAVLTFLANALREEGGFEYKRAVLDGVIDIMESVPEARNDGLYHLCEFIEDCEFVPLATRVLHLLGDQGPSAAQPASFIRYIYNRVILEAAPVRAAAVTALAKFATRVEDLRPSIIPLLRRCLDDDDDEVRDRATMYLALLGGSTRSDAAPTEADAQPPAAEAAVTKTLTSGHLPLPVSSLYKALQLYQLRPAPGAFGFSALPHVEGPAASQAAAGAQDGAGAFGYVSEVRAFELEARAGRTGAKARAAAAAAAATPSETAASGRASAAAAGVAGAASPSSPSSAAEALYKVPEFAKLGPLFRTSRPQDLTEAELEYLVTVVKHVFANHVVFQFTIRNTVPEVVLERAAVAVVPADPASWLPVATIAATKVKEGHPATAYACFARSPNAGAGTPGAFSCELRYAVREIDPSTGESLGDAVPETYPLDGVEIISADYIAPVAVGDFRSAWESMGGDNEILEQFGLSFKSVQEAVTAVVDLLGLAFCEGTGSIKPGANKHNAYLSGVFLGGVKVLGRMQVTLDADNGCVLKIGIRSENRDVSQLLLECIS